MIRPATRIRARLGATLICICVSSLLAACGHDDSNFYPSLADADKAGEITRGWLPAFLPKSSHSIREVHDLSPSVEWCTFDFLPDDSSSFRDSLKGADVLRPEVAYVPNPHVSWWPKMLTGPLDTHKIREAGLELYIVVRPSPYLFAVDWRKGRAFLYSR